MNNADKARPGFFGSDFWRSFGLVSGYLFVFAVLASSYLDTKYSFDIYRYFVALKLLAAAGYVYGAFAALFILSRIFGFSSFGFLRKVEHFIFVYHRRVMTRPLFAGMGEGRAALLAMHWAYCFASAVFYLFVLPVSIFTATGFVPFALLSAAYIVLPGLFFGRGAARRLKSGLKVFAAVGLAGAGLFLLSGASFARRPGAALTIKSLLVFATLAGALVSGYLNNSARQPRFAAYLLERLAVIYATLMSLCLYPALAAVGVAAAFLFFLYVGIISLVYYNYLPWALLLVAVIGAVVYRSSRERKKARLGYYLLFVLLAAHIGVYVKIPPTEKTCAAVSSYGGELTKVISFEDMKRLKSEFRLEGAPYDTVFDAETQTLIVAFKNRSGNGFLLARGLGPGAKETILRTSYADEPRRATFPERLQIDTANKYFYVTIKSPGRYSLCKGSYAGGELKALKYLNFGADEVVNSFLLPERGLIAVMFTSSPGRPSIRFYDDETMKLVRRIDYDEAEIADHIVRDVARDRLVMPSVNLTNILTGHHIYTLDMKGGIAGAVLEKRALPGLRYKLRTLYGAAYNRKLDRIYTASPVSHQILVVDGESMRPLREVPTGDYTRKISFSEKAQMLFIANYGDGTVDVLDARKDAIIRAYRIGPLPRSVTVDPRSGRAFAASTCGVYEIKPDRQNTFAVNRGYRLFYTEYPLRIIGAFRRVMP